MSELDVLDPTPVPLFSGPAGILPFTDGFVGPRPLSASDFRRYFSPFALSRAVPHPYGPFVAFLGGSRFGDFSVDEPARGPGAD